MKVVYKKTITEKLDAAITEATETGRKIEQIELTNAEWSALEKTTGRVYLVRGRYIPSYRGVPLGLHT
jgi:hypothetical protein